MGSKAAAGRQYQSRSCCFVSQTSPKQNKTRKEETLYFNLQCSKALFFTKRNVSSESRGHATVPKKKMGEVWWNSTWQYSSPMSPMHHRLQWSSHAVWHRLSPTDCGQLLLKFTSWLWLYLQIARA